MPPRARKTDPNFFLKRAWYDIGECIKKLIKELDEARARTYGSSKYHIVGEDEADPKAGSISFVSPVARSLMGKAVGEIVGASGQEIEIIAIS